MFQSFVKNIIEYSGEDIFLENKNRDQEVVLANIEKSLEIKLPDKYKQFYTKYAPFSWKAEYIIPAKYEDEVALCSYEMDAVVFFRFGYFLSTEDLLKYNLGMGKELGEIHKWDLIMIARGDTDPYSHVFLGIGEHNKDKIFYVNTQALPDDQVINTNGIGSSDGHFIKYIAKDVFQFARTLNFARINEDVIW